MNDARWTLGPTLQDWGTQPGTPEARLRAIVSDLATGATTPNLILRARAALAGDWSNPVFTAAADDAAMNAARAARSRR